MKICRDKKAPLLLAALAVVFMSFVLKAYAKEPTVLESGAQEGAGILYLADMRVPSELEVQISGESVPLREMGFLNESGISVDTLFLVDTSTSIVQADQDRIAALLEGVIKEKWPNRRYALMAFGEESRLLCDFTNDRFEFEQAVRSLQYQDEGSGFYTAVQDAVAVLDGQRTNESFVQLAVITDGVEYDAAGITQAELFSAIDRSPMPVHTFGCVHPGNEEALKSLYALARVSGGLTLPLDGETSPDILAEALHQYGEEVFRISFDIPDSLQDGGIKTIGLCFNGSEQVTLLHDLRMPMVKQPEQEESSSAPIIIVQEVIPEEPQDLEEEDPYSLTALVIAAGLAVAAVILLAAFFLLRKRKKRNSDQKHLPSDLSSQAEEQDPSETDATEICPSGDTHILIETPTGTEGSVLMVRVGHPDDRLEFTVNNPVIIGRNSQICDVAIRSDKSVSGKHCKIYGHNQEIYIEDLDSTNHTFVNGERIYATVRLNSGDVLRLGRAEYEIRFGE